MRETADSADSRGLRAVSRDPAGQRLSYSGTRPAALARCHIPEGGRAVS